MRKSTRNIIKATLFVLPLFFVGCLNHSKQSTQKNQLVIVLEKTPCFGKCPTYKAYFYINDSIKVFPKENFIVKQKSASKLEKGTVKKLLAKANAINFWNFEDEYDNKKLMDVPSTFIKVDYNGKMKSIKVRANAPNELTQFIKDVETTIKNIKWQPLK